MWNNTSRVNIDSRIYENENNIPNNLNKLKEDVGKEMTTLDSFHRRENQQVREL